MKKTIRLSDSRTVKIDFPSDISIAEAKYLAIIVGKLAGGVRRNTGGLQHKFPNAYASWMNMKYRCANPLAKEFKYYGARGITFDARWGSFDNFLEDMGERPKGMSLDRIDVNGCYSKENCRWATNKQQSRNTTRNVYLTAFGQTKHTTDWADEVGLLHCTLRRRVLDGWTPERALSTPPGRANNGKSRAHLFVGNTFGLPVKELVLPRGEDRILQAEAKRA